MLRLVLLLTVVPLAELYLLLWIKDRTSVLFTFGLVLATGVAGAALARWQGFLAMQRIQKDLSAGRMPAGALVDGFLIFIAGALLLTPGILTDLFGFSLLIPPLRAIVKRMLADRYRSKIQVGPMGQGGAWSGRPANDRDQIIDSYVIDPDEKDG